MDWIVILVVLAGVFGLLWFRRMSLAPSQTANRLLSQGAIVIDVRSAGEFASGHLPGAINIELGNLAADIGGRVPDKQKPLLLHCLSGGRSAIAKQQLKRMGYANVHNLGSYARAEKIVRSNRR